MSAICLAAAALATVMAAGAASSGDSGPAPSVAAETSATRTGQDAASNPASAPEAANATSDVAQSSSDLADLPGGAVIPETDLVGAMFELESSLEPFEVIVTSTTLSAQSIKAAPSVISVVTGEQLRALGLNRLDEVLRLLTGTTVLRTSSNGLQVAVRGAASPASVLVTLDGVRLNDFYDGSFPADLDLANIDRIEMIRGPGSALYGTNAFSAVISLFSRRGQPGVDAALQGEALFDNSTGGGGFGHARIERQVGNWTLTGFGTARTTTGARVLVEKDNSVGLPYSAVPGETNGEIRSARLQLGAERKGLFAAEDRLELHGGLLYQRSAPYFGFRNILTPESLSQNGRATFYAEYQLPLAASLRWTTRLSADGMDSDNRIQDQPANYYTELTGDSEVDPGELYPEGKLRHFAYSMYRAGASTQVAHEYRAQGLVRANDLVLGLVAEYGALPEFSYGQNFKSGAYQGLSLENYDELVLNQLGRDRLMLAAFAQDQLQLGGSLWLTVGLRFDHYSDFGSTLNPRAALVWKALPNLSAKLLYGRAFRAPVFRELYDQTGLTMTTSGQPIFGNEQLVPETTQTLEAALELTPAPFVNLRANGFYVRTADLVDADQTFNFRGSQLINYPGRQILGAEGELQLQHDKENYLLANASFFVSTQLGKGLPGWEQASDRVFRNKEMTDLPRLRWNVAVVSRPFSRLRLGASYSFVGASSNNTRTSFEGMSKFERPAFHEARLNLGVPLWDDQLELTGKLTRTFGETIPVMLASSFYLLPTNSTSALLGLSLRLD